MRTVRSMVGVMMAEGRERRSITPVFQLAISSVTGRHFPILFHHGKTIPIQITNKIHQRDLGQFGVNNRESHSHPGWIAPAVVRTREAAAP